MLAALKHKEQILKSFYLDDDDITIRRKHDDILKGKYKKDEIVVPYNFKGNRGYTYRGIWIPIVGTTIAEHWILCVLRGLDIEDKSVIDHIDGNRLNNSRDNIRITTQSINCRNKVMRKDNTTGYTGINYDKKSKRYIVRRVYNGKRISKSHKTLDGAIKILEQMKAESQLDGYTERHGQ